MRVLGTHLYQCTSWWCCERPWVFLKTLSTYLPVSGWVFYAHNCPQGRGFSSFLSKTAWPPCPTLTSHQISPRVTFFCLFVSLDKKSPQREMSCWCGKGETKNSKNSKRHQNRWVQRLLSSREKVLIGALHQMESSLKMTEVYTCKNKHNCFKNKVRYFEGSPLVFVMSVLRFLYLYHLHLMWLLKFWD